MRRMSMTLLLALVGCGGGCRGGCGGGSGGRPGASAEVERTAVPNVGEVAPAETPPGTYMGRRLADTMSHLGAEWLTRPERNAEENTALMHEELALRPGDVACDFGAGNGYHTLKMAEAVGDEGKAIAVDLQPEMLDLLRQRAQDEGADNVQTILATPRDPGLPPNTCDLVLLVDVYHELSEPAAVLANLSAALTKGGRIALLEYRAEDPDVPIKALHKMSKQQILAEYAANGLVLHAEFDGLPWQHLMFFRPTTDRREGDVVEKLKSPRDGR